MTVCPGVVSGGMRSIGSASCTYLRAVAAPWVSALALLAFVVVAIPVVHRVWGVLAVPDEVDRWRRGAVGERGTASTVHAPGGRRSCADG